jgi:hypothetical protein
LKKGASRISQNVALIIVLATLLFACDNSNRGVNESTNPVVAEKAAALLDALKAGDYEQAIKLYPDSFFVKQTREGWERKLKALNEERGTMKSYELKRSQADTRFSGKFFILEYMVVHEGNKRVNHIITLIAPVTGGGIKLVGHKMTSWIDDRFDEKGNPLPQQP